LLGDPKFLDMGSEPFFQEWHRAILAKPHARANRITLWAEGFAGHGTYPELKRMVVWSSTLPLLSIADSSMWSW
jgi:hypothetical protein